MDLQTTLAQHALAERELADHRRTARVCKANDRTCPVWLRRNLMYERFTKKPHVSVR
jgi:hypothetical protein